jgi:putative PIN family toxin of toxin-antitoxin system
MNSARVILDTNVLVSYLLLKTSPTGQAVSRALADTQLLASEDTLSELAGVLARPKFDKYVEHDERVAFFRAFTRLVEIVPVTSSVRLCRDPKDDKFLALAQDGDASLIITGDQDLLTLSPFGAVAILTPAQFLALPDTGRAGAL